MADTSQSSLFELALDQESIEHLTETARWGKFLAVVGFVGCGMIVIMAFVMWAIFSSSLFPNPPHYSNGADTRVFGFLGGAVFAGMFMVYATIYFFPCIFLYRFSVRLKMALRANDQVTLNQSLKAQKYLFRYIGVLTIIGVALGVIEILAFGVVALAAVLSHKV
jgi:uncharacterized membrane protein YjgN (DUF898 family)